MVVWGGLFRVLGGLGLDVIMWSVGWWFNCFCAFVSLLLDVVLLVGCVVWWFVFVSLMCLC